MRTGITSKELSLHNITGTARGIVSYCTDESKRREVVFHDPFGHKLAGEQNKLLIWKVEPGRKNRWFFVTRTSERRFHGQVFAFS